MVAAGEGLLHNLVLATHVAVSSGFEIHRLAKLKLALDSFWTKVEHLSNLSCHLAISHVDMRFAIGVYIYAYRLCYTDGIGNLYQHLVSNTCCYHVLSNIACGISCRAVYLA